MPSLSSHQQTKSVKMLLLGNSGSGKTGSLASLAKAGYEIGILDFDNGLDYLAAELKDDPKALARVRFKTCTDQLKMVGNSFQPVGVPQAFTKAMKALDNWTDEGEEAWGPISKWPLGRILVIDSLTLLSSCVMRHVLALNGRSGQQPSQPNWGQAMQIVEDLMGMLYSDSVPCNVVVISHIVQIGDEEVGMQGFPNTLGNKLPPKIPRFFNTMVEAYIQGAGATAKRKIRTRGRQGLDLKVAAPSVPPELDLGSGLADIFKAMKGPING